MICLAGGFANGDDHKAGVYMFMDPCTVKDGDGDSDPSAYRWWLQLGV